MLSKEVDKNTVKVILSLFLFISSLAHANEYSAFGFAAIIEAGNNKIIEVGDEKGTYTVRLDEQTYKKEIEALEVSSEAKEKALDLGQRFFRDFETIQVRTEKAIYKNWSLHLEEFSSDGQRILSSPPCDELNLDLPNDFYQQITFDLPQRVQDAMSNVFQGGQDLVVVTHKELIDKKAINIPKIKFGEFVHSYDESMAKNTLQRIERELASELSTLPGNLYIVSKDIAAEYELAHSQVFDKVQLEKQGENNSIISFQAVDLATLSRDRNSEFYGVQHYLDRHYLAVNGREQNHIRGEVPEGPSIPNLKDIKFYRDGNVEVSGLVDGGMKDDAESFLDPSSYYGRTGLKGTVNNLSVSVITEFDTGSFQAKSLNAEYQLFGKDKDIGVNFNWQLTNESRDDIAPILNPSKLGGRFGFQINMKF